MAVRFGASVWPWRWNSPYDTAIRRIGRSGFQATELIAWDEEMLIGYYTPATIALLRDALEESGMELSQFIVRPADLSSPDVAGRRAAIDFFKRGVDVGLELGAPIINSVTHHPFAISFPLLTDRPHVQTFTVDLPEGLDWPRNWGQYVDALVECAAYAQANGVLYSLEPHPFRYGGSTEGILRLIEAVDSPALGVNFDPSHLFPVGDLPQVSVYRLAEHLFHCHFSDNDGQTNAHWRPGRGKIDWKSTLAALSDIGYSGVISLELEDIPGVSRSGRGFAGSYEGGVDASEGFVEEYQVGLAYLSALADEVGLQVAR